MSTFIKNEFDGNGRDVRIAVDYTAQTEIADEVVLREYVCTKLASDLHAIDPPPAADLQVDIQEFTFTGKVRIDLTGTIDHHRVDELFIHVDKRPNLSQRTFRSARKRLEWRQRNGLALLCIWLVMELVGGMWRVIFPTRVARAVGRRFVSGRALQSLDKCIAGIRTHLKAVSENSSAVIR